MKRERFEAEATLEGGWVNSETLSGEVVPLALGGVRGDGQVPNLQASSTSGGAWTPGGVLWRHSGRRQSQT